MTNEEKFLRSAETTSPSEESVRRMHQLFAAAPPMTEAIPRHRISLWQAAAVALTGIVAGWLIHAWAPMRTTTGSTPPIVQYVLAPAPAGIQNVFDWTQYPPESRPGHLTIAPYRFKVTPPSSEELPDDTQHPSPAGNQKRS